MQKLRHRLIHLINLIFPDHNSSVPMLEPNFVATEKRGVGQRLTSRRHRRGGPSVVIIGTGVGEVNLDLIAVQARAPARVSEQPWRRVRRGRHRRRGLLGDHDGTDDAHDRTMAEKQGVGHRLTIDFGPGRGVIGAVNGTGTTDEISGPAIDRRGSELHARRRRTGQQSGRSLSADSLVTRGRHVSAIV